ncbi:MAG: hypothetical protein OHK0029_37050 [Armatimonadaceae bacterium]
MLQVLQPKYFRRSQATVSLTCTFATLLFTVPGALAQDFSRSSSTIAQYLSLRQKYPPAPGVTPAALGMGAPELTGKTLEVEGRLSGVVHSDTGAALLMLSTTEHGSLTLKMALVPRWMKPGTLVRALVTTPERETDEVRIGMPELLVVAAVPSSEFATHEAQQKRLAAERAESERQRAALAVKSAPPMRATYSSRSSGRSVAGQRITYANVVTMLSPAAQGVLGYYQGFIQDWNKKLTEGEAQVIASAILLFCEEYDVDPRLVVAMVIAESDFRPHITSHKGAMGLGQLMPDEVKELGITDPYDLVQNIYGAVYLLRKRLDKYSGGAAREDLQMKHIILALASYNAGMGAVKKYGGVPPYRETQNYVKKIERIYRDLCGGEAPR